MFAYQCTYCWLKIRSDLILFWASLICDMGQRNQSCLCVLCILNDDHLNGGFETGSISGMVYQWCLRYSLGSRDWMTIVIEDNAWNRLCELGCQPTCLHEEPTTLIGVWAVNSDVVTCCTETHRVYTDSVNNVIQ